MNDEIKQAILLERYKAQLAKEFSLSVAQIEMVLNDELLKNEISSLSAKQLERLLQSSNERFTDILNAYFVKIKSQWSKLFQKQLQWLSRFIGLKSPKSGLKSDIPLEITTGLSLDEVIKNFTDEQAKKLVGAMRLAYHKGLTNQDLVRLIRGTKARQFQDGILATTTRNAQTIAKTGVAIVANQAKQEFIQANREYIAGIRIIATLDTRTSPICRHLDYEFYRLDEAKYPPYHFNCRSTFQIIIKGDNIQVPMRASMNGATKNVSYYEWLQQQSNEIQDIALGKKRAKLFRSGEVGIEQFKRLQFDRNFEPLTLDEMAKLEPLLFGKVFEDELSVIKKRGVLTSLTQFGEIAFNTKQLDRKFKHAEIFSIDITQKNSESKLSYYQSLIEHLNDKNTVQFGVYRGNNHQKVYYNNHTGIAVVIDDNIGFITCFIPKDTDDTLQLTNYLKNGLLW